LSQVPYNKIQYEICLIKHYKFFNLVKQRMWNVNKSNVSTIMFSKCNFRKCILRDYIIIYHHMVQFQKNDYSLIKSFLKKVWNLLDNEKNK